MGVVEPALNYHPLVRSIARSLRRRCAVVAEARMLIACSGGADSVALLRALATLAPRRKWRLELTVAHVQHHLRPNDEAERDAAFVASLAERLGLRYARADVVWGGPPAEPGALRDRNVEAEARRQRYALLERIARERGATFVATAHHGDDQLETILMRLLRGASVRGLAGMAWRRSLSRGSEVTLVRPMLGLDRAAVVDYLRALDQPWCEDRTNADVSKLRAMVRHKVLPALRDVQPGLARRAVALGEHFRLMQGVLDDAVASAERALIVTDDPCALDRRAARAMSPLVLAGVLRRRLSAMGVPEDQLTQRVVMPIVRAIRDRRGDERRFRVAGGVAVVVSRARVVMGKGE